MRLAHLIRAGMAAIVALSQHSPGIEFGGGVIQFISLANSVDVHRSLNIVFTPDNILPSAGYTSTLYYLHSRRRFSLSFSPKLQVKILENHID